MKTLSPLVMRHRLVVGAGAMLFFASLTVLISLPSADNPFQSPLRLFVETTCPDAPKPSVHVALRQGQGTSAMRRRGRRSGDIQTSFARALVGVGWNLPQAERPGCQRIIVRAEGEPINSAFSVELDGERLVGEPELLPSLLAGKSFVVAAPLGGPEAADALPPDGRFEGSVSFEWPNAVQRRDFSGEIIDLEIVLRGFDDDDATAVNVSIDAPRGWSLREMATVPPPERVFGNRVGRRWEFDLTASPIFRRSKDSMRLSIRAELENNARESQLDLLLTLSSIILGVSIGLIVESSFGRLGETSSN